MSQRGLPPAADILRAHDPERLLTTLMAPPAVRAALIALYAFDCEIGRVRHVVTQPMAGLIRLQWWREALDGIAAGEPRQHPVSLGLADAWPLLGAARAELERAIDARERELDQEPFADMAALEAHAMAIGGSIGRAALVASGGGDAGAGEAAGPVGAAYALVVLLRETEADLAANRTLLPVALLEQHGMSMESALARAGSGSLGAPARLVAARARAWLDRARGSRVSRSAVPALLPATLARRRLARLARDGHDPLAASWRRPDPVLPLVLLGRRMLGRF